MLIPRGKHAIINQYVINSLVGTKGARTLDFYCGAINPTPIKKDLERVLSNIYIPPLCINGQLQYIISNMDKNYTIHQRGTAEIIRNADRYILSDTLGIHARLTEVNHYLAWYYGICDYRLFPVNIISKYHVFNAPINEKKADYHMRIYNKIIAKLQNTDFTL
jgi:hypothetical protein